jgi:hypothetical protein
MVQLRRTLVEDVRVRAAIVLLIAAIIGWQFLPVWLRFALVMYAEGIGCPMIGGDGHWPEAPAAG